MLEIRNLNLKFRKKSILENVSYKFTPGVYCLLGANGEGKTSLMRCMTGIYNTENVFYNDHLITLSKYASDSISYLPQQFGLYKDLTVKEMLLMLASLKGINIKKNPNIVDECVHLVNLSEKINEKVKSLSGGMIKRLGIAQTLLNDPKVIILDEPTAGLDIEERLRFKNIINNIKKDKVIIFSTHIASDVEALCDQVLVMQNKGIVFSGSIEDIKKRAQGKTYSVIHHELLEIKTEYEIQDVYEIESLKHAKILSTHPLSVGSAKLVSPSIEDGYICLLKNI